MEQFLKGYVEKDSIKDDGTLAVCVATDASVDRDGEIVEPEGLNFDNFNRNPVLLYAHDYRSDPIGRVEEIRKEGGRVLFRPKFAVDINPRAKMFFEMFKAGILNAFSIGFIPRAWEDRDNGDGRTRRVFTETELLEISAVPVPSNPNALVLAREFKFEGKSLEKEVIDAMEKAMKAETKEEPVVEPVTEEKGHEGCVAAVTAALDEVKGIRDEILTHADKGEQGKKEKSVDELLRHPDFHRGVLKAVDKALGISLRDMNKAGQ